jgi:hypothetical protein
MTRLAKEIREIIKAETAVTPADEVALDEMGEFFADGERGDKRPYPSLESILRHGAVTSVRRSVAAGYACRLAR